MSWWQIVSVQNPQCQIISVKEPLSSFYLAKYLYRKFEKSRYFYSKKLSLSFYQVIINFFSKKSQGTFVNYNKKLSVIHSFDDNSAILLWNAISDVKQTVLKEEANF